ncbi:hypothetical protein NMY22_g8946 [Coprinellus aureogranulatus]|nr:hypothetical protein NMY22_g8946 [Coprinellus aureogranulatus]
MSFLVDAKSEGTQLKALESLTRAISRCDTLNYLAASGSLSVLNNLLRAVQVRTLEALQLVVSNRDGLGLTEAGVSIAQNPPFTDTKGLRHLSIEGFALPLTSRILIQSHHMTTLSQPIQRGSNLSSVLDVLKSMPSLQRLTFHFLGPLRPPRGSIDPVHLPDLSWAILKGNAKSITATLSISQFVESERWLGPPRLILRRPDFGDSSPRLDDGSTDCGRYYDRTRHRRKTLGMQLDML